mmetsp:Transcript_12132/g.26489  ORF Transcript_12132/g.26489 Transcript_12132/m.26489 type:complete len:184 (-) Transcript_12132:1739-2290(-)
MRHAKKRKLTVTDHINQTTTMNTTTKNHSHNDIHLMSFSSTVDEDDSSSNKEVRFASHSTLRQYEDDDSDPRSVWYSHSDYERFKYDRFMDAARIRVCRSDDLKENECFWGLENVILPEMRERVLLARARMIKGVISEQKSQWTEHRYNPHGISKSCSDHTEWSAKVARKKALFYSSQIRINM